MRRPFCLVGGARRAVGRSLAALVAASLLAGCGSSAATPVATATATPTSTRATSAIPAVSPSTAPTATVLPTAITYGPVTVVSGVETCDMSGIFGEVSGMGTSVQHSRNGTAKCTDKTDDPRVSGAYTATWNMDYWGTPDHLNGAVVQWGTARLTATGGTWEGRATGVYSSDHGDTIVTWWTGTGAYAGLAYFELVTGGAPWKIQGQIFPGSPPTP